MTAYRGRFAPSPSGDLHFGSLLAAVASYVDARANGGKWLLRIEDIDPPRERAGSAQSIIQSLAAHGFCHDETILLQSTRHAAYRHALETLVAKKLCYRCECSRASIMARCKVGEYGAIYDGRCRELGLTKPQAIRIKTSGTIEFIDAIQGAQRDDLAKSCGDFHLIRADGLFAYHLALVVDDAFGQISHVVRGYDLLASSARQIFLQQQLNFTTPHYAHIPLACDQSGAKLSKQTHARALDNHCVAENLRAALLFLGQPRPPLFNIDKIWQHAIHHWDIAKISQIAGRNIA